MGDKLTRPVQDQADLVDGIVDSLRRAVDAASAALEDARTDLMFRHKGHREIVTNCDIASENAITQCLSEEYPKAKVLSEEVGEISGDEDLVFIVDPIDGTHNFIHQIPLYAISIGVYARQTLLAGMIHMPEFGEYLYAVRGQGAFRNGSPIACSDTSSLRSAMVAYDNQFHKQAAMLENLSPLADACFTLRVFGSACVDLANTAQGRIDARVFHRTKLVDFAAGQVIVEEAGGTVTDFQGRPVTLKTQDVIASNGSIHQELVEVLSSKDRGHAKAA